MTAHAVPDRFIWTKMQAAGDEPVENILRRKELERQAGLGVFWWGIGESKGPAIERFIGITSTPLVLFSLMLSRPAAHDRESGSRAIWETYIGSDGTEHSLPPHVIVTSGALKRNRNPKDRYYALVCHAGHPIRLTGGGGLNARALRNIGGKAVGSSQVTAVVERAARTGAGDDRGTYRIDARAALKSPYCADLVRPRILTPEECRLLDEIGEDGRTVDDWLVLVRGIRRQN